MASETGLATTATRAAAVQSAASASGGVSAHIAGDYWQHNQFNWIESPWPIPASASPPDQAHADHEISGTWMLRFLVTINDIDYAVVIPAFGTNAPVFVGNGSWSGSPFATAPSFVQHPSSASVPEGGGLSLTASANGTPPLIYRWTLDGVPVAGANSDILTLANFTSSQAGNYVAIATNANGQAVSEAAVVTLQTSTGEPVPTRPI